MKYLIAWQNSSSESALTVPLKQLDQRKPLMQQTQYDAKTVWTLRFTAKQINDKIDCTLTPSNITTALEKIKIKEKAFFLLKLFAWSMSNKQRDAKCNISLERASEGDPFAYVTPLLASVRIVLLPSLTWCRLPLECTISGPWRQQKQTVQREHGGRGCCTKIANCVVVCRSCWSWRWKDVEKESKAAREAHAQRASCLQKKNYKELQRSQLFFTSVLEQKRKKRKREG